MKLNCLIIDDDPIFRVMLRELVEKDHQRLKLVDAAKSAEEAEEIFEEHQVDLLFLDLGLPGKNGFELIESLGNPDDLQIILITAHEEHALDAYDYGVVDYLVKPVSNERFRKAVSKAIRNRPRQEGQKASENRIFEKLTRYMYSRDIKTLNPLPVRLSKLGYAYPMLSANFDFEREHKVLDVLSQAEEQGFLNSEYVDTIYLCNSCYNSQLYIRESCPSCQSTDLEMEDLVHHFSCAYMGPISDFHHNDSGGNNLTCPKCEKRLRHIGVDYDKPSVVYECRTCDHTFQNPVIRAKCESCSSDTKVEYLVKKRLKKYQLTQAGLQVGQGRYEADLKGFSSLEHITDPSHFLRFLHKSVERYEQHGEESCIGRIELNGIASLYDRIGQERSNQLVRELHDIISQDIGVTDEVVFPNRMTIMILFTDMNKATAEDEIRAISHRVAGLLSDNFDSHSVDMETHVEPVSSASASEQFEHMNKGATA